MQIRRVASVIIALAGIAITFVIAAGSDAWAVGQIGAAIGESAIPMVIGLVSAVIVWPRKPKAPNG